MLSWAAPRSSRARAGRLARVLLGHGGVEQVDQEFLNGARRIPLLFVLPREVGEHHAGGEQNAKEHGGEGHRQFVALHEFPGQIREVAMVGGDGEAVEVTAHVVAQLAGGGVTGIGLAAKGFGGDGGEVRRNGFGG